MAEGTYAALTPDGSSIKKLIKLQQNLRLSNPLPSGELHMTVMFSRKTVEEANDFPTIINIQATGENLKILDGRKPAIVLLLDSPEAGVLFKHFMQLGATHDYDEFMPHITLSYDYTPADALRMLQYELEPGLKIRFNEFSTNDLDLEKYQ
tara:strand:- start:575 stop:1027 length:453 start_codon:yes stop_codon:yes gene_type:complete